MGRASIHRSLRFGAPVLAGALLLALGAAGCAVGVGGGNNGSASQQGTFIDSKVEGLEFNAGGLIGSTDADGTFAYDPNTPVTFFVGDIVLGTGEGAPVMTPVSLVSTAHDETSGIVTNITRFLMTIDDDRDPTNGILISDAVRAAARGLTVDFTLPPSTFSGINGDALQALADATSAGGTTVTELAAQAHLHKTLLELFAGSYGGDFSGDDTGTWTAAIDTDGAITAHTVSGKTAEEFDLTGTAQTNGNVRFTVPFGPDFTGKITPDGGLAGTWQRLPAPGGFDDGTVTQFGAFTGGRTD